MTKRKCFKGEGHLETRSLHLDWIVECQSLNKLREHFEERILEKEKKIIDVAFKPARIQHILSTLEVTEI
jgi:hypothetical protein